jgi:hypothetical protein
MISNAQVTSGNPVERYENPDGRVTLHDHRGETSISCPAPWVVLMTHSKGECSEALMVALLAELDNCIARVGAVVLFGDAQGLTVADPTVRPLFQKWLAKQKAAVRSFHALMPPYSKIVTMMIVVLNMVFGGSVNLHKTRGTFAAALRDAINKK